MLAGAMAAALVMTALPIHATEENNTFLQEDEDALRVFSNKEKDTEEKDRDKKRGKARRIWQTHRI